MRKSYKLKMLFGLSLLTNAYAANLFESYDNYLALDYKNSFIQNLATMSSVGVYGEALLDNNLWFNLVGASLLSYDVSNNTRGLKDLSQNKSGTFFTLRAGYAFNVTNFNFIPYLGFNYNNVLVAYNYDSTQQFIVENPSYNLSLGVASEFNLVDKHLKLRIDNQLFYSTHKAVLPNTSQTLGHLDYQNYIYSLSPELQYNINRRITLVGYYAFNVDFGGNANPPNVYYPAINISSANIINNDAVINSFGLRFGVVF